MQHHHPTEGIVIDVENLNIYLCDPKHAGVKLVLSELRYNNLVINKSIIMAVSISTTEFVAGVLGLVDHATSKPITTASFSNITFASADSTIFTVATDPSNSAGIIVTGVGAGTANLTVTADVAYTDPNTNQPVTATGKSVVIAVTVTPSPVTADLTVNFGTPQAKP